MMHPPRELPDGTLRFSRRGSPPGDGDIPDGYYREPADPYVLRRVLPDCQYRTEVTRVKDKNCDCKEETYLVCIRGYPVDYKECTECIKSGRRDLNVGGQPESHNSVIERDAHKHTLSQAQEQSTKVLTDSR